MEERPPTGIRLRDDGLCMLYVCIYMYTYIRMYINIL